MYTGFFGALQDDSSSDSGDGSNSKDHRSPSPPPTINQREQSKPSGKKKKSQKKPKAKEEPSESVAKDTTYIPPYEDLSNTRADEETVLQAVYGDDFRKSVGAWNQACLEVMVRPPDIPTNRIGSTLLLSVLLNKKYPYVLPKVELREVKGLSKDEQGVLLEQCMARAKELSENGSVMMIELVQVAEDFLLAHNQDPTMSLADQMKAREATAKEAELKEQEEMARLMDTVGSGGGGPSSALTPSTSTGALFQGEPANAATDVVERELGRQRKALEAARQRRASGGEMELLRRTSSATPVEEGMDFDENDDDDFDFDGDYDYAPAGASNSRYQSDFIELGVLGRGGGGEVVKVRNRLDRRIYAVKKILLEPEKGPEAKAGAVQNRKLRREVTTISRMNHRLIVRYYQAWVEGGSAAETIEESPTRVEDGNDEDEDVWGSDDGDDSKSEEEDDDEEDSNGGFWTNSPIDDAPIAHMMKQSSNSEDNQDSANNSSESDTNENSPFGSKSTPRKLHSDSLENMLEHENDHCLQSPFQSPLLAGLGFENELYQSMAERSVELEEDGDSAGWDDESSVKVDPAQGRSILYIQMEYCETTLRKLIDEKAVASMEEHGAWRSVWRMIRQTLEALVFMHSRKIIHRDLKPGNIFIDAEGNIRLGDFGLATKHRKKTTDLEPFENEEQQEHAAQSLPHATMDDLWPSVGSPAHSSSRLSMSAGGESMTGGVGTAFYRAPEQEGTLTSGRGDSSYTVQADMFSFRIIVFEMFHPPFTTYMERAETLTRLRGDHQAGCGRHHRTVSKRLSTSESIFTGQSKESLEEFKCLASDRFPEPFIESVPENAQRIILWCMEREPGNRPSAEELLSSDLIPRKIELEQRYLEEALELLTSFQSESHQKILEKLFDQQTPDVMELTFDTDVALAALERETDADKNAPSARLVRAIRSIRTGALDRASVSSLAMSASSLVAATSALERARLGRGRQGMLRRSAQRTAGILAMRAATAAAVTGSNDGVHGSDPIVVEAVCERLISIFQCHGAVHLRSPLLRPRPNSNAQDTLGNPAALLNERGGVLLLPEDLTANFARSLGRGGVATSHLKRYDIDRVFHRSDVGCHPREELEASFDVVYGENVRGHQIQAEVIMVASQVLGILPSHDISIPSSPMHSLRSPIWFLRLNHTRLADSILELCGVPQIEMLRKECFDILTRFTAPAPHKVASSLRIGKKTKGRRSKADKASHHQLLDRRLADAMSNHEFPRKAADKFRVFVECCFPLPPDIRDSIEHLQKAIMKIRNIDKSKGEPRRVKRFEDAMKSLRRIKDLIEILRNLKLDPILGSETPGESPLPRPVYISLDLGLRQKRKHFHGGIIFQCIALPDAFFEIDPEEHNEHNDTLTSAGRGLKLAEGGEFADLVRRFRPPGNFATTFLNHYSTAPIPTCTGVRFSIGKLVELIYLDAARSGPGDAAGEGWNVSDLCQDNQAIEKLRHSLRYPFNYGEPVRALVTSVHGMDSGSIPERFLVASRLWREGVKAEYLPQSGVIRSLCNNLQEESSESTGVSDWSLMELFGVCSILRIPFVVIVQPHLYNEKGSVRLRRVTFDTMSQGPNTGSGSEMFVSLDNLASTILSGLEISSDDQQPEPSTIASNREFTPGKAVEVECIYVDNDQYYGEVNKQETPQWKALLKAKKRVTLAAEGFLSSVQEPTGTGSIPVFASSDLSFWMLRDFGTVLMRHNEKDHGASSACEEMIDRYPRHRRTLKVLANAIDNRIWGKRDPSRHAHSGSSQMTVLLYSKPDDRFDVITLNCGGRNGASKRKG